jgi:type IV pilus assembly protein PilV
METTVNSNNSGFTLIEFLVAIVILMVGLLGLLQTVNYAIAHNMVNQMRQTALIVGDELMNKEKLKVFDAISTTTSTVVSQQLVNGAFRSYSVVKTNTGVGSQSKNIDLQVTWRYKGVRYVHSVSSLVSKAQ